MISFLDLDFKPLHFDDIKSIDKPIYTYYPILNELDEFIGFIDEEDVNSKSYENLKEIESLIIHEPIHPLLCMMRMKELDTNILFWIEEGEYKGAITYQSLIHFFQDQRSMTNESAILTMSVPKFLFSLSELSQIVESEMNSILSFNSFELDHDLLEIELVFRTNDLKRIIGILENKGYLNITFYNETGVNDHLKARYENLMTYLNI